MQLAGEASQGQIHAQLDRYLIRWLTEHNKTVGDAIELPADLDDLGAADLTAHVRRCAQALLRADKVAAASHPDAVKSGALSGCPKRPAAWPFVLCDERSGTGSAPSPNCERPLRATLAR